MPEQNDEGAAAATPGAPAAGDQAASRAQRVDLDTEVAKAASKAEREARNRASLDLIDNPDHKKIAERLVNQGINDYRKKLEEGKDDEFVRKSDFEKALRDGIKQVKLEAEAVTSVREWLADNGIKKGTEDQQKFDEELAKGFYDKSKLTNPELLERIARSAQVGRFRPVREIPAGGTPFTPSTGVSLRAGEKGKNEATSEVAAVMEMARKAQR